MDVKSKLRLLRWRARRWYAVLRYGAQVLNSSPILFGNSFPKSGTHLLAQILSGFHKTGLVIDRGMGPLLTFERSTGRQRTDSELLAELNALHPGDMAFGHIIASAEIITLWKPSRLVHFFMLRDPRDVVVSHAFYIGDKATQNVHHAYYKSLPDLNARLTTSIMGRPDFSGDFPDIGKRFSAYLGWLDQPDVCVLRFEEFILDRQTAIGRMWDCAVEHGLHKKVNRQEAIEVLGRAIAPGRSFTFRSGNVGEWQKYFTN